MQAFHNDPGLKKRLLEELREHARADRIRQGTYGSSQSGRFVACAIGCCAMSLKIDKDKRSLHHGVHGELERLLGIPADLLYVYDGIFEGMVAFQDAVDWSLEFIESIPVGANLSKTFEAWARSFFDRTGNDVLRGEGYDIDNAHEEHGSSLTEAELKCHDIRDGINEAAPFALDAREAFLDAIKECV